jgi:hypothetical protein
VQQAGVAVGIEAITVLDGVSVGGFAETSMNSVERGRWKLVRRRSTTLKR